MNLIERIEAAVTERGWLILVLSLTLTAAPAQGAARYPFEGAWAGGPTTCSEPFRFTSTSYQAPGTTAARIAKVEQSKGLWNVKLRGGYSVTLGDVKRRTMTWYSPASGDSFDLTRC